jgi:hypothetical protein
VPWPEVACSFACRRWPLPGTELTIPALVCHDSTSDLVAVMDIMNLHPEDRAHMAPAPAGQHRFEITDAADNIIFSAIENNGLLELGGDPDSATVAVATPTNSFSDHAFSVFVIRSLSVETGISTVATASSLTNQRSPCT